MSENDYAWSVVMNYKVVRRKTRAQERQSMKEEQQAKEKEHLRRLKEESDLLEARRKRIAEEWVAQLEREDADRRAQQNWIDEDQRKRQYYCASEVTISDPSQTQELVFYTSSHEWRRVPEMIICPLVHDLYRLPHLRQTYTFTLTTNDKNEIICRGRCIFLYCEVYCEVCYGRDMIIVTVYKDRSMTDVSWTLIIRDVELAYFFQTMLANTHLPPFSQRVFKYCPYILAWYIPCSGDPYMFHGKHVIHGHLWEQHRHEEEIKIDYSSYRPIQCEILYAGMLWTQRLRNKMLDQYIAVLDVRKIVGEYLA
jgi:hypothetical protein